MRNSGNSPQTEKLDFSAFLQLSEAAAKAGGSVLTRWMGKIDVTEKNVGDYVTQADIESQMTIQRLIHEAYPDHAFLGEEQQNDISSGSIDSEFCWIVDPLDGTTNYIHQLPSFSVSVALRYQNKIIAGCVFDPLLDETYLAARNQSATLNGQPIEVSNCKDVDRALLVCSFPNQVARTSRDVARFVNVLCDTNSSIRRLGSAALNLCYVACGRLDGYWATSVNIWDIAAGLIILEQAGGRMHSIENTPLDMNNPKFVATANDELHRSLRPHLLIE
jgi:myo-inositol-1(or 4)-monophosphatase